MYFIELDFLYGLDIKVRSASFVEIYMKPREKRRAAQRKASRMCKL